MTLFESLPPYDSQAEESVVASILVDETLMNRLAPVLDAGDITPDFSLNYDYWSPLKQGFDMLKLSHKNECPSAALTASGMAVNEGYSSMRIHFTAPDLFNSTPGFYYWATQRGPKVKYWVSPPPKKRGRKPNPQREPSLDDAYMESLRVRFASHTREGDVPEFAPSLGPCLIWVGSKANSGYGASRIRAAHRKPELAHRVALFIEHWLQTGEISLPPEGHALTVDHLCRVKLCVRASHLEWVTQAENLRRIPKKRATS